MRLPYNPYIFIEEDAEKTLLTSVEVDKDEITIIWHDGIPYSIETIKPYLRSMSSMTEDEERQYRKTQDKISIQWDDCGQSIGYVYVNTIKTYDWLNKNHFDYRNLIKKSLAIIAPEGMYKIQ